MPNCSKCSDTGVIETGNNDLPCDCPAGDSTLFNVAGVVGPVKGVVIKRHFLNNSPQPLELGSTPVLAFELLSNEEKYIEDTETPQEIEMFQVVIQKWEESELGWGVRPDGYSLHLNNPDREAYIKDYWKSMPPQTPEDYSRPCGSPGVLGVSKKIHDDLVKSKNGLRFYGTPPTK